MTTADPLAGDGQDRLGAVAGDDPRRAVAGAQPVGDGDRDVGPAGAEVEDFDRPVPGHPFQQTRQAPQDDADAAAEAVDRADVVQVRCQLGRLVAVPVEQLRGAQPRPEQRWLTERGRSGLGFDASRVGRHRGSAVASASRRPQARIRRAATSAGSAVSDRPASARSAGVRRLSPAVGDRA
ncbi:MAG: hypothetical protein AVDCRST_MAG59-2134 [uncultured Thermomicrobiales bacterium]|uniref:Uncharacterized protein n=1 Tax=uncultured Thermomicrobiales bacterium TaxID=1645740 RepID=A0A6J4URD1_9BACT|nr:MAG: hypothetical protein AVDCRST_MAG59-2134 [uncultured Thermomicrobiales bacterium]